MVKKLTQHQLEIITDLYHEVDGQARVFVAADTIPHSPLYWLAHECRGLITMRKNKRRGKTYRKIALTDTGVLWCEKHGIYAREPIPAAQVPKGDKRNRKTIAFQVEVEDTLIGQVEACKGNKDFIPVIRVAMALYTAIGYQAFQTMAQTAIHNLEIFQMSPDELAALYADMDNEWQRLELERGALEAQTLEVRQFHDMFKSIDNKLDRLQNTPQSPSTPRVSDFGNDDETILMTVQKDATAAKKASENFLRSLAALNPVQPANGNPRQLSVQQFAVPDYEDEDDEKLFG